MGKKNPFIFTIGFDKSDPDHVYVTELLNTTEKKAKLIVAAILAYTERTDETGNGSISMEPDMPPTTSKSSGKNEERYWKGRRFKYKIEKCPQKLI